MSIQREHEVGKWSSYYENLDSMMSPNEYLLKMLVASYPEKEDYKNGESWRTAFNGQNCLDLGCGDGRNCVLMHKLGMRIHATEVSDSICQKVISNLGVLGIEVESNNIRTGFNNEIPFESDTFDLTVSWNGIYYLDHPDQDILDNFSEVSRVMKPGALFICSVPASRCYSLRDGVSIGKYTMKIMPSALHNWGGGLQDGTYYYCFENKRHLEAKVSNFFREIRISELYWDGFGAPLHYYIFSALKK